jgi:hypothetical protein
MEETKYPLIPDGLIIYLEQNFPNEIPMGDLSPRELGVKQGEQGLIQHLKQVKQWSEDKDVQD